jgi:hypothetical protein
LFYDEMKGLLLEIDFDVFGWVDDAERIIPEISLAVTDIM